MKYLKTWIGISGTNLPEREFQIIYTVDGLARSFDEKAEYYQLEKIDVSSAVKIIKDLQGGDAK